MSTPRLPYAQLSPHSYQYALKAKEALNNSPLGHSLLELVNLRVSQINGCAFCLEMHAAALRKAGEPDCRIDSLAGWQASTRYSEREKAALAWVESLTHISQNHAPDDVYTPLKQHFSDAEISDLTFAIGLMNAFNRVAIAMRQ